MKDKMAKRRKAQRRRERQQRQQEEKDKVVKEFNEYQYQSGKSTSVSPDTIYKAYKRRSNEFITQGIMTAIMMSIYVLSEYYGYRTRRLTKVICRMLRITRAINDKDRTLDELHDELLTETKIDSYELLTAMPKGLPPEKEVLLSYCYTGSTLCLYPMYLYYGWKHNRLRRFRSYLVGEIRDGVLYDKRLKSIKQELYNRYNIKISDNGSITVPRFEEKR